jgi:phosphoribosylanthranilate isomerase
MIIQIYTIQTPQEGIEIARLGVDHIGVTPADLNLPGEVSIQTAIEIFAAIRGTAKKVALSVDENLDDIVAITLAVHPDILHLCGDIQAVPPAAVAELRTRIPGVEIMQAIPVSGSQSIEDALSFQEVADYLILDTKSADVTGIGASGAVHDWNISREIVQKSNLPVILAGGLSPENVAEAVRFVKPWGVDSLTHTNHPLDGGRFNKDLAKVEAFVKAAWQAAQDIS